MKNPIVELMISPHSITITRGETINIKCGNKYTSMLVADTKITEYKNYNEMDEQTRKECFDFIRYIASEIYQEGELKVFSR